jgi:hypothetical protein
MHLMPTKRFFSIESNKSNEALRIVLVCDLKYLMYARALIYSVYLNCSNVNISLFLYSNQQVKNIFPLALRKMNSNTLTILPVPLMLNAELPNFYSNIKAKHILEVLKTGDNVLSLDVDSLVRNAQISELLKYKKVGVVFQKGNSEKNQVLAGTIFIPNNKKSFEFFKKYSESFTPYHYSQWYSDQILLYRAYIKDQSSITRLPEKFCDLTQSMNSSIWQGIGGMKFNRNWRHPYTREFSIYLLAAQVTTIMERILRIEVRIGVNKILPIFHLLSNIFFSLARIFKRVYKFKTLK